MTVLPFEPRSARTGTGSRAISAATGSFTAPSGLAGTFSGSYRLERLRTEHDQLVAVGVLTGVLCDADSTHVTIGSRRHTAAADVVSGPFEHVVRLGPVDVNLAGFMVAVDEISVVINRE